MRALPRPKRISFLRPAKKIEGMVHFLNKLIFFFNLLAAVLLGLSWVLPYLPPHRFPSLALLSLMVPLLILVNLVFLIYWAILLKKRFWLSFVVLLISYFHFHPFYNFSKTSDLLKSEDSIKIMSYNVRLFNAYEKSVPANVELVMENYLNKINPDVLCIQEYYLRHKVDFSEFPYQYVHFKNTKMKLGNAIFSKYPLINKGAFDFKNSSNNTLYADVVKGKDTLRVYSTHLQSIGILPEVKFLQESNNTRLIRKISAAFKKQEAQIKAILAHKAKTRHPVVICGDFNNTPFSYSYRKLKGEMQDAFLQQGAGLGTTFLFDRFPLRIDYILVSQDLDVLQFETLQNGFSDHKAIWTSVGW